jgi:hypothetical protein
MRVDHYAVVRWLATDDLAMLTGYERSATGVAATGWMHGFGGQRRLTAAGWEAYEQELLRRSTAGLDLDPDPLNPSA